MPAQQYSFVLADYNPSVLQLVTLPNFILTWALHSKDNSPDIQEAFSLEDELELTPAVLQGFETYLQTYGIDLSFLSGGWSAEFVQLLYTATSHQITTSFAPFSISMLLGAETIYSPFALQAFTETTLAILKHEKSSFGGQPVACVAAKRLYFGVGGSLDDFVDTMQQRGANVTRIREEADGVRRGVVLCTLGSIETT